MSAHEHQAHHHTHGAIDPAIFSHQRGLWAVRWSFLSLAITALFQFVVVYWSGSVALLADTVHNLADALTAIPLWAAFRLARRAPTKRFTYGYGRVEDLAGASIVVMIAASGVLAGGAALDRLRHPQVVTHLWAVGAAAIIGAVGNEAVALFRIRVGKEIGSAALVADGRHARADGLTSLAVLGGVIGVALGHPLADPIIGMGIAGIILLIAAHSGLSVLARLLDGIDPDVVDEIRAIAQQVPAVTQVSDIRVRWIGHRLQAEINIAVEAHATVLQGHDIADCVRHEVLHHLPYLSFVTIHVDPATRSGEAHHRITLHQHGSLPQHGH
jgi:cation diffusion facilitator family transporter